MGAASSRPAARLATRRPPVNAGRRSDSAGRVGELAGPAGDPSPPGAVSAPLPVAGLGIGAAGAEAEDHGREQHAHGRGQRPPQPGERCPRRLPSLRAARLDGLAAGSGNAGSQRGGRARLEPRGLTSGSQARLRQRRARCMSRRNDGVWGWSNQLVPGRRWLGRPSCIPSTTTYVWSVRTCVSVRSTSPGSEPLHPSGAPRRGARRRSSPGPAVTRTCVRAWRLKPGTRSVSARPSDRWREAGR